MEAKNEMTDIASVCSDSVDSVWCSIYHQIYNVENVLKHVNKAVGAKKMGSLFVKVRSS
jgi:hypothetical protein